MRKSYKAIAALIQKAIDNGLDFDSSPLWFLQLRQVMNADLAMCMSFLIGFQPIHRPDSEKINHGWFLFNNSDATDLFMHRSIASANRKLQRLQDLGFITVKRTGFPALRRIKINTDKVVKVLRKHNWVYDPPPEMSDDPDLVVLCSVRKENMTP